MEMVRRLPARLRLLFAAGVLYFVFSFLDWQQVSALGFTVGRNEWNGVGVVAGLLGVALLLWEGARLFGLVRLRATEAGFVSLAVALLLALFTLVTFLSHDVARHWPAWVGLVLAAVIAVAASLRAREEGLQVADVQMLARRMQTAVASTRAGTQPATEPPAAPAAADEQPPEEAASQPG